MADTSLGVLLAERARLTPAKEALVDRGARRTFAEFDRRATRLAAHLRGQGIAKGDRIALIARNSDCHATTVLAAAKLGAIAVVINWRLTPAEVDHIFGDSLPAAVVYQTEFATLLTKLPGLPPVRVHEGDHTAGVLDGSSDYADIVADERGTTPRFADAAIDQDDPAVIMYTSGTTGRSKGAVLTHRSLLASSHATSCTVHWTSRQRFLLVAPMFHIGGLCHLVTNLMRGTTTVMLPDFQPAEVWRTIESERITTMMTVPAMLRALLAADEAGTVDASGLDYMMCGGSAVTADLIRAAAERGIDVQPVYGATEFTGPITFWINETDPEGLGSAGQAIMNCELAAFDVESATRLGAGETGEIWVRGPMAFAGYWRDEEATSAALVDGWYRTGDVGFVDERGRLFLRDRLKDVIISGGENIYPAELEATLLTHEAIAEVAVVGRSDGRWGEVPIAFVVPRPGTALTAEEVMAHSRRTLASYKTVKDVIFVSELPKNAVGKILRRRLRQG